MIKIIKESTRKQGGSGHEFSQAEVIEKRIMSQLRRNGQLQPADFTITVSHSFLDTISRDATESMKSFVGQVAAGIQLHIGKQSFQERSQR